MRTFNDDQIDIIRDIAEHIVDQKLDVKKLIEVVYDPSGYYEINHLEKLQDKVEKLEKLTGFNADDYEWEITTNKELIRKKLRTKK